MRIFPQGAVHANRHSEYIDHSVGSGGAFGPTEATAAQHLARPHGCRKGGHYQGVPADAGPLASPSDTGPGADGDDAEQPVHDVLLEVDDGIPLPAAAGPERPSVSSLEDSPGPAREPGDEIPAETPLICAAQQDVLGHAALDTVLCETAAGPDPEAEVAESASPSSDVSEEIGPDKLDDGDREADPAPVIEPTAEQPTSSASTRPRQPAVHRDLAFSSR